MSDKFWEQTFKGLNSELQWIRSGDILKRGADVVFAAFLESCSLSDEERAETDDRHLAVVATLLYGLAMENILKAALLKEGIAKSEADGRITWNVEGAKDHDLLSICRSSKLLGLNGDQEKLLERMSAFVHWAGKYPTPLTLKATKDFKGLLLSGQPQAAPTTMPVEFRADDKTLFEEMYRLLWKKAFPLKL